MFVARLILAIAFVAGVSIDRASAAEQVAEDQPAADDSEKFQGAWKVVRHDTLGNRARRKFLAQEHQWVFAKDDVTMKDKGGVGRKGKFQLDSKKDPKTLDITLEPGLPPGPKAPPPEEELLKCIYTLDGDTLTVCYGYTQDRPKTFESKANPGTGLVVLRRQPAPPEKSP